jgi:type II secretory pathway component PulJ
MSKNRRTAGPGSWLHTSAGYSLVEITIAMIVSLIVGLAIYAIFNAMQRGGQTQRIYNQMQTDCNFAMDQMRTELMRAGYRIPQHSNNATYPISRAEDYVGTAINPPLAPLPGDKLVSFEYYDDNARNEGAYATGYSNATQITYVLDANNQLVRRYKRFDPVAKEYNSVETAQVLATNVMSLSFDYLGGNDAAWNGVSAKDIRTIRPTLVCNASRPNPNTGKTAQITLTTEVRARNIGVDSVAVDTTPPASPTGLVAWDPGTCGSLQLRWNANTETDLAGYIIFYGPSTGDYTKRLTVGRGPGTAGQYEYLSLDGLDSTVTGITPQPQYFLALEAYDKSGNVSPLSLESSGNPATSIRTLSPGSTDSTINPLIPPAPTGFTATPGHNQVTLTWDRSTVPGLKGYRLYRSPVRDGEVADPNFTPDNRTVAAGGNRIKHEQMLDFGPDTVSFTDTGLLGCSNYYYKIAAIACDTNIPVADMLTASVTGVPTDNVLPTSPTLVAKPGYRRIILNLTNPTRTLTDQDFLYTKIWYSTVTYPTFDATTKTASGGSLIPDAVPYPGSPGTFTGTGTIFPVTNFNSLTNGDPAFTSPTLPACTNQAAIDAGTTTICDPITYYFIAVSFDQCQNTSLVTAASMSEGTQCGDCNLGEPCYGAPPAPTGVVTGGCSSVDGIALAWNALDTTTYRDLAGYHIWRCDGLTCASGGTELTGGTPTWFTTVTNTNSGSFPVVEGMTYSYRIEAADCYYERRATVTPAERAANNPDDNGGIYAATTVNNLSVGRITLDPVMSNLATGYLLPENAAGRATLPAALSSIAPRSMTSAADGLTSVPPTFKHNSTTVWVKNTAASDLTLTRVQPTWTNPAAYLQQVAFGDGLTTPMTRLGWRDGLLPLSTTSGTPVSMGAGSRVLKSDDKMPLVALFQKADGTADNTVDGRQQSMTYRLYYTNDSTGSTNCSVDSGELFVPLGPYAYGTSQDQPADGTRAWAVPGDAGGAATNTVTVGSGSTVNVFTNVFDSSGAGISAGAVKLYYAVTDAQLAAPLLDATAEYPNLSPYTPITLAYVSGNTWRTPVAGGIPSRPGKSIWYFITSIDNQGNFDRDPEIGSGAFQYYQQQANVCVTVPNAPTLTGVTGADRVTLTWTPPASNTDTSAYLDGKGYKIYRRQDGASWLYLATVNSTLTDSYVDIIGTDIATSVYDYRVTAFDLCLPNANEGAASNVYTETAEGPCGSTPNAPVLSGTTDSVNNRIVLSWTAPTTNTSGSTLIDLSGYRIWRRIDTAPWYQLVDLPAGTTTYTDLVWSVGLQDFSYYVTAFDSCAAPSPRYSAPSNTYTDSFTSTNPCDTYPGMVGNLVVAAADPTNGVRLAWTAPTNQGWPSGWPYNDPGGFYVYRGACDDSGSNCIFDWITPVSPLLPANATGWTDADASVKANLGLKMYMYYVRAVDTCPQQGAWAGPVAENYTLTDPCTTIPAVPWIGTGTTDNTGVTLFVSAPVTADLAGYEIQRTTGADSVTAPAPTSTGWITIHTVWGANLNATYKDPVTDAGARFYWYRVRSFDTCGPTAGCPACSPRYSAWSTGVVEWYDYCSSLLPFGPTSLVITAQNAGGIDLQWLAPSPLPDDLGGYLIERSANATTWTQVGTALATALTYHDTPPADFALAGVAYSYRVRANDLCASTPPNYSPYSNVVQESFTDPCVTFPTPNTPTLTAVTNPGTSSGNKCRSGGNPPAPDTTKAKLTWSWTANTPANTTVGWEIFQCDTATCTPAAPAVQAALISSLTNAGATVELGSYLALKPYRFSVKAVFTGSASACVTRSPMSNIVEDNCN